MKITNSYILSVYFYIFKEYIIINHHYINPYQKYPSYKLYLLLHPNNYRNDSQ